MRGSFLPRERLLNNNAVWLVTSSLSRQKTEALTVLRRKTVTHARDVMIQNYCTSPPRMHVVKYFRGMNITSYIQIMIGSYALPITKRLPTTDFLFSWRGRIFHQFLIN